MTQLSRTWTLETVSLDLTQAMAPLSYLGTTRPCAIELSGNKTVGYRDLRRTGCWACGRYLIKARGFHGYGASLYPLQLSDVQHLLASSSLVPFSVDQKSVQPFRLYILCPHL